MIHAIKTDLFADNRAISFSREVLSLLLGSKLIEMPFAEMVQSGELAYTFYYQK